MLLYISQKKKTLRFIIQTITCMPRLQSKQLINHETVFSAIVIPTLPVIMLFQAHTSGEV